MKVLSFLHGLKHWYTHSSLFCLHFLATAPIIMYTLPNWGLSPNQGPYCPLLLKVPSLNLYTCNREAPIFPLLFVLFGNISHWFCTHFPTGRFHGLSSNRWPLPNRGPLPNWGPLPNRWPLLSYFVIGPWFECVYLPTLHSVDIILCPVHLRKTYILQHCKINTVWTCESPHSVSSLYIMWTSFVLRSTLPV